MFKRTVNIRLDGRTMGLRVVRDVWPVAYSKSRGMLSITLFPKTVEYSGRTTPFGIVVKKKIAGPVAIHLTSYFAVVVVSVAGKHLTILVSRRRPWLGVKVQ